MGNEHNKIKYTWSIRKWNIHDQHENEIYLINNKMKYTWSTKQKIDIHVLPASALSAVSAVMEYVCYMGRNESEK